MSDIGDYGGGYSGEQSTQTEANFLQMMPGETEAEWRNRLAAAGYPTAELPPNAIGSSATSQGVPPGTTSWQNQIGKTSGTGNGSTNIMGTTPEAMRRGAGGSGPGGGSPVQSAGSSSYANALAGLMAANAGSGGGGQGGGMDQTGLHGTWAQGMGMGTQLAPQGSAHSASSGPGMFQYGDEGIVHGKANNDPGSMPNVLRQLLMGRMRPTWINSAYTNQPNPYDQGGYSAQPMARNYLNQLAGR